MDDYAAPSPDATPDVPGYLRRLPIDVDEVAFAMDNASSGMLHHFLDRETGEVLLVSEDELPELAEDAARIEADPERYLEIPPDDSRAAYQDMEDFVETVEDPWLRDRLERALDGPRPFRRFKDAVAEDGAVEERWFRFRDERLAARVIAWLAEEGLAPEW